MLPKPLALHLQLLVLLFATVGCQSADTQLVEFATQATAQQARQNDRIAEHSQAVARQSQELASTAHALVDGDAAARRELLDAHRQLQGQIQVERFGIDHQREELHTERRAVIAAAAREPLIAQAIVMVGPTLAALLPLLVTAYALGRIPESSAVDETLINALLEDLLRSDSARSDVRAPEISVSGAFHLDSAD